MNYKLFFKSALAAGKTLYSGWSYKTAIAAIMVVLLHKHAILFYAFSALVVLDCLTKWLAIAHDYLVKQGKTAPTILQSLIAIKAARSAGLISSEVMKHRFLGKICIYLLCVMAADSADLIMVELSKPAWAVSTIIGYLTATELLSICENLSDAGIEAVGELAAIIKRKKV